MENKRFIAAIVLSMAVLLVWTYFFSPPEKAHRPNTNATSQDNGTAKQSAVIPQLTEVNTSDQKPVAADSPVVVTTPLYKAVFNTAGGVLKSLELRNFRKTIKPQSESVNLVSDKASLKAPLGITWNQVQTWSAGQWSFSGKDIDISSGANATLVFTGRVESLLIERHLTFSTDSYLIKESTILKNNGNAAVSGIIGFTDSGTSLEAEDNSYNPTQITLLDSKGFTEMNDKKDLEKGISKKDGLKWASIADNYFISAILPITDGMGLKAKFEDGVYRLAVEKENVTIPPGQSTFIECNYYLGPKDPATLAGLPNNISAAIDYGWFDFIAKPLLVCLKFFYKYVGNWGLAIILLTVVVKIIFWPLSQKSYKSMEQMQKLQPMLAKIREKYKDDRQKMNEEMMALYKTYKVNPAGGCLPMVVQIPVFFGLYKALLGAIELRHAPFIAKIPGTDFIWLADLSTKDPYYITPIIMGLTMFIQQKMTPSPGDPTQAKVMLVLPVVFTFMFLSFPSGLVIYWLVNNVLSIMQQMWVMRKKKS